MGNGSVVGAAAPLLNLHYLCLRFPAHKMGVTVLFFHHRRMLSGLIDDLTSHFSA